MGSWTAYAAPSGSSDGRLIVALGRSAGGAVTRSRVRRLARDAFNLLRDKKIEIDLLLMARDDIRNQSRRDIRKTLQRLMTRGAEALGRRGSAQDDPVG